MGMKSVKKSRSRKPAETAVTCGHKGCKTLEDHSARIGKHLTEAVLETVAVVAPDLSVQVASLAESIGMLTASVAKSMEIMSPELRSTFLELVNDRLAHHFKKANLDVFLSVRS